MASRTASASSCTSPSRNPERDIAALPDRNSSAPEVSSFDLFRPADPARLSACFEWAAHKLDGGGNSPCAAAMKLARPLLRGPLLSHRIDVESFRRRRRPPTITITDLPSGAEAGSGRGPARTIPRACPPLSRPSASISACATATGPGRRCSTSRRPQPRERGGLSRHSAPEAREHGRQRERRTRGNSNWTPDPLHPPPTVPREIVAGLYRRCST